MCCWTDALSQCSGTCPICIIGLHDIRMRCMCGGGGPCARMRAFFCSVSCVRGIDTTNHAGMPNAFKHTHTCARAHCLIATRHPHPHPRPCSLLPALILSPPRPHALLRALTLSCPRARAAPCPPRACLRRCRRAGGRCPPRRCSGLFRPTR